VSGVTAIGQPPLINMMAGIARPLLGSLLLGLCLGGALGVLVCSVWQLDLLVSCNKVI
jgi:hypothetical protein